MNVEELKSKIEAVLAECRAEGPRMTGRDPLDIIERWHLSNQMLSRILGRKMPTVTAYKYRGANIPQDIADKLRRLDAFLDDLTQT